MAEDFITQAKSVLQTEIDELANLSRRIGPEFTNAVNSLREGLTKSGKIIVIGVGKSENIATKIAATLNSTGATAVVLNCQNALHGDLWTSEKKLSKKYTSNVDDTIYEIVD